MTFIGKTKHTSQRGLISLTGRARRSQILRIQLDRPCCLIARNKNRIFMITAISVSFKVAVIVIIMFLSGS